MATAKTVPEVLQIARISQYLAANSVAKNIQLKGYDPDENLPIILYMERKAFENLYNVNPSSASLREAANYVYSLCGKFAKQAEVIVSNLSITAPVVTGPSDTTVSEGNTATFTISVTSSLSYTVAWYKDGVLVSGQTGLTLSVTADLVDDGALYHAVVTSTAGSTSSSVAVLTVSSDIIGYYYVGDNDYFSALDAGTDAITFTGSFAITDGEDLSVTIAAALANNKYHVYKYPASQGIKTAWSNTTLNYGQIPDSVFRSIETIGSWNYIISRVQISIDTTSPMTFS